MTIIYSVQRKSAGIIGLAVLLIAPLAGCSPSMIASHPTAGFRESQTPSQTGGSYFLAKHHLKVIVTQETVTRQVAQAGDAKPVPKRFPQLPEISIDIVAVPDRQQLLDTGLMLSPYSNDTVRVNTRNGLLSEITSSADDRTATIIQNVAKTVYSPLFRDAGADVREVKTLFQGEFDPFEKDQADDMNKILNTIPNLRNSCIAIEVAPNRWIPESCKFSSRGRNRYEISPPAEITTPQSGIYYRRPIAHRIAVRVRSQTRFLGSKEFANRAPLLRIDIERTTFVNRQTTITFAEGAPTSVQVQKPSEAEALSTLPLKIAVAPLEATTDALNSRRTATKAESDLLAAEADRIKAGTQLGNLGGNAGAIPTPSLSRSGADAPSWNEFQVRCTQLRLSTSECLALYNQQ